MKFRVDSDRRRSVRLERPGPRGRGKLSLTFQAKDRWVEIPDVSCSVFAASVADLIARKVLIVPKRDGVLIQEAPAPVEPKFRADQPALAFAPVEAPDQPALAFAPVEAPVEVLEADIEAAPEDAPGRRYRRRS